MVEFTSTEWNGPTKIAHSIALISRNGKFLVSGLCDRAVRLWDTTTRQQIGPPMATYIKSADLRLEPERQDSPIPPSPREDPDDTERCSTCPPFHLPSKVYELMAVGPQRANVHDEEVDVPKSPKEAHDTQTESFES
ncbi:hypothetical protein PAXINDRAFT_14138 [Paxillus involutus ATCC 200175]|uniref:Uncharacterized protein n=1 Tax=Paxillus involutus ATCC 200175 TaxID=664439 RepID=A0A0C9TZV9_PAXIN|nr:hypothetical protein PAXINDRAFT_14138 [Paxillus involutus ATCC 200175]